MIGCAVERHVRLDQPSQRLAQRRAIGIADGHVIQPRRPRRRRLTVTALPRIESDVMMIAPGRQKRRLAAHARRDVEAENAVVKGNGAVQVGDLEMDVSDVYAGIDPVGHPSIIALLHGDAFSKGASCIGVRLDDREGAVRISQLAVGLSVAVLVHGDGRKDAVLVRLPPIDLLFIAR